MITVSATSDGRPRIEARLSGIAAYLDTFAIVDLAKGSAERRTTFLEALRRSGSLLFSMANMAELSGQPGAVATFLDEIGPRWVPLELNPQTVVTREAAGEDPQTACLARDFITAFFQDRLASTSGVVSLDPDNFWQLRAAVDWNSEEWSTLLSHRGNLDDALKTTIATGWEQYDRDPLTLRDPPDYDRAKRATYVFSHLVRQLILEAKSHTMKKGDGLDFFHAVMGAAFGSFALLDKHWKQRLTRAIPDQAKIARLYYAPELDQLVDSFDRATSPPPAEGS